MHKSDGIWNSALGQVLTWGWSLWAVHAILRLLVLGRDNAFGLPLVAKIEWYLFHAWCFDFRWIFLSLLPWIITGWYLDKRQIFKTSHPPHPSLKVWSSTLRIWWFVMAILLPITVIDHETQRFMGSHMDPALWGIYGNTSAIHETLKLLGQDQSIPWLGPFLLFTAIPLWLGLQILAPKLLNIRATQTLVWSALIFGILGWIYTEVLWKGGHRARKLAAVPEVLYTSWKENQKLQWPDSLRVSATQKWQEHWLKTESSETWRFADTAYPLWKSPKNPSQPNSQSSQAWNVVFLILESHRAVHAGYLHAQGAWRSCTPLLDSLAPKSHIWTRFNAGGVPTISALMSTHLSISEHPRKFIASGYTHVTHKAFPQYLRDYGWQTRFFSAPDPAWDNQTPWLAKWYDGTHYDRQTEEDQKLFATMGAWLKDSLHANKPFFVTAMTKTNHYPFNPVSGVEIAPEEDLEQRMCNTMRYTEEGVSQLIESSQNEPWFRKTLWVIMADHGFSLGSHGSSDLGNGLYSEHIWVPLLIWSPQTHPLLGAPQTHTYSASQLDLAPTFMDLAGIREANHFMGHSLLRLDTSLAHSFAIKGGQVLWDEGPFRLHTAFLPGGRSQGDELFEDSRDRRELHNLLPKNQIWFDNRALRARERANLNTWALEQNRLMPPQNQSSKQP